MARRGSLPGQTRPARRASIVAALTAGFLALAIYFGSDLLRTFDAALIGYATATVVLAFGVVYRYVMWIQQAPTRRYFARGWRAFLSVRNFRRFPTLVPKELVSYLGLQLFLRQRSKARWLAHLAIFWGVVLATVMTFALSWGWIHFQADEAGTYQMYVWGLRVLSFAPFTWFSWIVFHLLDLAALLVIAGCGYFLWRRVRDREVQSEQRLGYDFLPLILLIAISVTGLLLTFSSVLLGGAGYEFLAIVHMGVVVLSLVFIPFGKFFHVIQRPAVLGVQVFKQVGQADDGVVTCRRCGEPLESAAFVRNLQETMDELDLRYGGWIETCPRCKRVRRGQAYLHDVKRGF